MSAFKGTPGKWATLETPESSYQNWTVKAGRNSIARVDPQPDRSDAANAAAIALVPQMVDALQEAHDFVRHINTGTAYHNTPLQAQLEAILAALRESGAIS